MEKFSKIIKIVGYVDYAASTAVLAYGIYAQSVLYIAAGLLGYVVAFLKPAERLKAALGAKFVRKPPVMGMPAAEVSLPNSESHAAAQVASFAPRVRYQSTTYYQAYAGQGVALRDRVDNVRNALAALHGSALRLRLGVRAEKIDPRVSKVAG